MSFAKLLIEPVLLIPPTTSVDQYGNQVRSHDAASGVSSRAWLTQTVASEDQTNRDSQSQDWYGYLLPDAPIAGDWQVQRLSDGVIFEVVGPPKPGRSPNTAHRHIRVALRYVTG